MTPHPIESEPLTAAQIELWADRIAAGRDEFPADVPDGDRSRPVEAVRRRLRHRLLRHVARAIVDRLAGRGSEFLRMTDDPSNVRPDEAVLVPDVRPHE